jgi:hypothetical protein
MHDRELFTIAIYLLILKYVCLDVSAKMMCVKRQPVVPKAPKKTVNKLHGKIRRYRKSSKHHVVSNV